MIQEFLPPLTVRVIARMNVRGFVFAYPTFLRLSKATGFNAIIACGLYSTLRYWARKVVIGQEGKLAG